MLLSAFSFLTALLAPRVQSVPFVPPHLALSKTTSASDLSFKISSRSAFNASHNDKTSSSQEKPFHNLFISQPGSLIHDDRRHSAHDMPLAIVARAPGSFKLDIRHHIEKRETASTDITFGSYWFASATAGNQYTNMLVDTGSADLWIVGPSSSHSQQEDVRTYNPALSRTAIQMPNHSFQISYGDGKNGIAGPVFQDVFSIGSAVIEGMPIGSASDIQGIDPGTFKSGIIGLGFRGGNSVRPNPQPTFMEALKGVLDSPVMVCNFKMAGGGSLEFGYVDTDLFHGSLTIMRADNGTEQKYPASWSAEKAQYVSNGKGLGEFDIVFGQFVFKLRCSTQTRLMHIIDTGGPATSGPEPIVRSYYSQIPEAKDEAGDSSIWTVPCDSQLPDLEFHFREGQVGKIPGQKLIKEDLGANRCQTWFGLESGSVSRGLVGHAFFESNVVVFDQQEGTIAWALKA